MKKSRFFEKTCLIIALFSFFIGCLKPPADRRAVPPPPAPIPLEKTFGLIQAEPSSFTVSYKSIRLEIDPQKQFPGLERADAILLTTHAHADTFISFGAQKFFHYKVMAPAGAVGALKKAGFAQARALGSGQRIVLNNGADFVFISALPSGHSQDGNGYFLAFDNGRNLLFCAAVSDEPTLRNFLYSLRDDGQQVDILISNAFDTDISLAEKAGLFQPTVYLIQAPDAAAKQRFHRPDFQQLLADHFYRNAVFVASPGSSLPF